MDSINCNRAVRSRWSFMPSVLLLVVGSAHFWAALYHPVLSKSICIDCTKAHSLVYNLREPLCLTLDTPTLKKASLPVALAARLGVRFPSLCFETEWCIMKTQSTRASQTKKGDTSM